MSAPAGDVPEDANAHCPGTGAEEAGKADGCAGCPNQSACASAPKGPDPALSEIVDRMCHVKHKVLVLSGKGGVGKSTFSAQLAFTLAQIHDKQVGLMDVDVCGPSIPKMLGLEGEDVRQTTLGWEPVYVQDNLAVMSIGFLLKNPKDPILWRGPRKNGIIKQFLKDVAWGELDFLLVDTPPGTSDEHLSITSLLTQAGDVDGAIVVTTPQDVALIDVRKELNFCKKVNLPVLGVVENMSGFICTNCEKPSDVFKASEKGGAEAMAREFGVPFLGRVPLDPRIRICCDRGESFTETHAASPAAQAFLTLAQQLRASVKDDSAPMDIDAA